MSGGKIVVTASTEERDEVSLHVLAVDAESGEILWNKALFSPGDEEARIRHAKNGLASCTPVIEDGIVYAHFSHMGTAALKLADGEVLWTQKIEYKPVHGTGSSPVVVDGLVVFHADGAENPTLVALDKQSGEIKWRVKRNQEVKRTFSFSTPLVLEIDGRTQIVSQASGMVGAYDPADGSLIWKVTYGEGYSVVPRPVYSNGLIYVATGFDQASLLAIRPDGAKGDVTKTHVVWEEDRYIGKTPCFVAGGEHLYLVDDTGSVTCRDGKSGKLKWREKAPGNFSSSPVLAGDKLYLSTEDGVSYVMEVSPRAGKVITEVDMGDRIFASPAIVDGAVFIRSEGHLWKISGK
jgi:outer membrane protein assembly factor BamB